MGSRPPDAAKADELPATRVGAPRTSRRIAVPEVDPCPPGTIVGDKYEVTSRIGRGGMGIVVAAKHVELGHMVAIKIMDDDTNDVIAVRRFMREGRAAAALKSDHAVRIYDVGRLASGLPYLVMELLEGRDLAAHVRAKKPLSVDDATEFIVQATSALAEAHANGLIHRDLKPHNLFLAQVADGGRRVKVLDFGLAKEIVDDEAKLTSSMLTPSAPEGTILGSPHFMSPEQIRNAGGVDRRTDIWSLGATFFMLLTGEPPFHSLTIHLVLAKILTDRAPDVRTLRSDVPEGVAAVIARCLEREPKDRFASVDELVLALHACGATKLTPSTRTQAVLGSELVRAAAPAPGVDLAAAFAPTRNSPLAPPDLAPVSVAITTPIAPPVTRIDAPAPAEPERSRGSRVLAVALLAALLLGALVAAALLLLRARGAPSNPPIASPAPAVSSAQEVPTSVAAVEPSSVPVVTTPSTSTHPRGRGTRAPSPSRAGTRSSAPDPYGWQP